MSYREIKVIFYYEGNYQCEFNCTPYENVREVCSRFAKQCNMSFYSLFLWHAGEN